MGSLGTTKGLGPWSHLLIVAKIHFYTYIRKYSSPNLMDFTNTSHIRLRQKKKKDSSVVKPNGKHPLKLGLQKGKQHLNLRAEQLLQTQERFKGNYPWQRGHMKQSEQQGGWMQKSRFGSGVVILVLLWRLQTASHGIKLGPKCEEAAHHPWMNPMMQLQCTVFFI